MLLIKYAHVASASIVTQLVTCAGFESMMRSLSEACYIAGPGHLEVATLANHADEFNSESESTFRCQAARDLSQVYYENKAVIPALITVKESVGSEITCTLSAPSAPCSRRNTCTLSELLAWVKNIYLPLGLTTNRYCLQLVIICENRR